MTVAATDWLVACFQPTTFFTLKPAGSTSSGGKSLLAPTPFALKMALLDVALRFYGQDSGQTLFPAIRDLKIALKVPRQAVVNNTFIKIMRPHKGGVKDITGTGLETPLGHTIAFREYVSYRGEMCFAFQGMAADALSPLLPQINYLGKRGGFIQLQHEPVGQSWSAEELKQNHYIMLTAATQPFSLNGLLQMLDDCGPKMTFDHANIYSRKRIRLGQERILHHVVLPYQLVRSSRGYSYYERLDE